MREHRLAFDFRRRLTRNVVDGKMPALLEGSLADEFRNLLRRLLSRSLRDGFADKGQLELGITISGYIVMET